MEFSSFEEALRICLSAADGSFEQVAALNYCLQTAPPDLRMMLTQRLGRDGQGCDHHQHGCGCGCDSPKG